MLRLKPKRLGNLRSKCGVSHPQRGVEPVALQKAADSEKERFLIAKAEVLCRRETGIAMCATEKH